MTEIEEELAYALFAKSKAKEIAKNVLEPYPPVDSMGGRVRSGGMDDRRPEGGGHTYDNSVDFISPVKSWADFHKRLDLLKTLDTTGRTLAKRYLKGFVWY